MIKSFFAAALVIAMSFIAVKVVVVAFAKEEHSECLRLQKLSTQLRPGLFFLTPTEKAQCDERGVIIKAPIRSHQGL